MEIMNENSKRGYLNSDFLFFHIKDRKNSEFEFHYHDFYKIIIFISGNVTYLIEGKTYRLKPWDILFVSSSEIHKPVINVDAIYERMVIWIKPSFLKNYSSNDCTLMECFDKAGAQKSNLLRLGTELPKNIKYLLTELEESSKSGEYGSHILKNALLVELMVRLNRLYLKYPQLNSGIDIEFDKQIDAVLEYINSNLGSDLSIDNLSSRFFMSKYYLMHKFKLKTGFSIHSYIIQKKLIYADLLIKEGKSITEASIESGFGDYSNFVRTFKKMFGVSPRKYYKIRL